MKRLLVIVGALLTGACGSSTAPTPPPTVDPPAITCPASQTTQLITGTSIAVTFASPTVVNGKPPVTTACTVQSGAMFNVGTTTVSCTATDALQRASSCLFTVTVLPAPVLIVTRFLAFGDSITRGEDGVNGASQAEPNCPTPMLTQQRLHPFTILPDAQTYPGVLQQQLASLYTTQSPMVTNRGCPGEAVTDTDTATTTDTLRRFEGLVSSGQYDAVLLMEGTNDLMDAESTGDMSIPIGAEQRLRQMVEYAKGLNLRPFLATIPPMNPAGSRGMYYGAELVPAFNSSIRLIAAADGVPLVDVEQKFGGNLSLLGDDGVHPTPDGYKVIAGAFFDAINSALELRTSSSSSASPRSTIKRR